ncbi:ATP-binding protein [Dongia soli]|uniref:histidine kinase n=1 Tax=Dongia soli TaxID=600628 RepID=A0ABU5EFH1_9PROT|nr:ATP-binding protein [Dongia soli]MDY0884850.1 ATP-binding protein [Dongia soli]
MLKRRLFWKILIGFWITFFAIMEGTWAVFTVYNSAPSRLDRAEDRIRQQVSILAVAIRYGGGKASQDVLATWSPDDRQALRIETGVPDIAADAGNAMGGGEAGSHIVAAVQGADGMGYRLDYDLGILRARLKPRGPLDLPRNVILLGLLGGLVFAAGLAWYLTRPIQRLRGGFEKLAQGDLGTRLQPEMGGRRDELADLAHDFDIMAARLQQLVASREQLLHDVSHELRSPLARLQVAIDLARQNPQRVQATLERVDTEARRLNELVGEVLTLSRAESGAPQLDDYFDLDGLVRKVVSDAQFEAGVSGIVITVAANDSVTEDGNALIQGNAELIRRALENIIRNALRHSTRGQQVAIELATDRQAGEVVIRIADQGPGVDPGVLESIFDPFVRGEHRSVGFGLGLAIARRAVLAHGGRIAAENRQHGGLVVTIRLPVTRSSMTALD